jgi:hypothetical protein
VEKTKINFGVASTLTILAISTIAPTSVKAIAINLNTGVANYSISGAANVLSGLNLTTPNPFYLPNSVTSSWIGPRATAQFTLAGDAPVGVYRYSTVFSLAGLDKNTATFVVNPNTINTGFDNGFIGLFVNGTALALTFVPRSGVPTQPSDASTAAFNAFNSFTVNDINTFRSLLTPTNNTISFDINNAGRENINPTGFRSELSLDLQPVPYEFEAATGLLLFGGYFVGKRYLKKRKSAK